MNKFTPKEIEVIKKWLPIVAASMLSDYAEQGDELKKWIKFLVWIY